jgi:hypothetical protein
VLAGAAGVGKSRLASEVSIAAGRLGFATAKVVTSRAVASIPFGSFAPLLRSRAVSLVTCLGYCVRRVTPSRTGRTAAAPVRVVDDELVAALN